MTREEAIRILWQYDVSAIQFYETDGGEIPWDKGYDALERRKLNSRNLSK